MPALENSPALRPAPTAAHSRLNLGLTYIRRRPISVRRFSYEPLAIRRRPTRLQWLRLTFRRKRHAELDRSSSNRFLPFRLPALLCGSVVFRVCAPQLHRRVDGAGKAISLALHVYWRTLEVSERPDAVACQLWALPYVGLQSPRALSCGDAPVSIQATSIVNPLGRSHSYAATVSFSSLGTFRVGA